MLPNVFIPKQLSYVIKSGSSQHINGQTQTKI